VVTETTTEETSGVMRMGTTVTARIPAKTASKVPTATVIGWEIAVAMIPRLDPVALDSSALTSVFLSLDSPHGSER
jgi:hypothetical protein